MVCLSTYREGVVIEDCNDKFIIKVPIIIIIKVTPG